MVFLFVILLIVIAIITLKIKVEVENVQFNSYEEEHLKNNYIINIKIYIFRKLPIFKIKIDNNKVRRFLKNDKIMGKVKAEKNKIILNKNDINMKTLKALKNIKIDIKKLKLDINIGTENAATTAVIIPILSTIIAISLRKKINKYNQNHVFKITPIYMNQNLININFSGIFEVKMIHIINTICILNKERKIDKYERTSHRRPYGYSYE